VLATLAVLAALATTGCAGGPLVERAYDGHVVEGRPIGASSYAAFLAGAVAEASGDAPAALQDFDRAARLDGDSPEIWARIGAVRCTQDPADRRADDAFSRALRADPRYAGAWAAKARCLLARKDEPAMLEAARHAAELDPSADGANALLARAAGAVRDPATRDALVALTETARDRVAAWDALVSWAASHGDVALWSRALEALVKIAPSRRAAVARSAEELAGAGQFAEARAVAASAVEAGEGPFDADKRPLAARLAVDEAIGRGEAPAVMLRATRTRVGLEEAGARALLAGQRDLARAVVAGLVAADPGAIGARMVLAASEGRDLVGAAWEVRKHGAHASAATVVAFGEAAGRALSPADARATLAAVVHAPAVLGDDRVVRTAVELVTRGALDSTALPPDGLVELAMLRGQGGAEGTSLPDPRVLDARHEYLAAALADPKGERARELGARLAGVAASDPVVAAAAALVQIGTGAPIDAAAARALLTRDPRDPLLAATALRLATKTGDAAVASEARESLATF
jgi:Tfp pilus assembly protein PilF